MPLLHGRLRVKANEVTASNSNVFSAQSVGRLASGLHGALRNQQLALPDDRDLLDELAKVANGHPESGSLRR